jgi:hypothetical protein
MLWLGALEVDDQRDVLDESASWLFGHPDTKAVVLLAPRFEPCRRFRRIEEVAVARLQPRFSVWVRPDAEEITCLRELF